MLCLASQAVQGCICLPEGLPFPNEQKDTIQAIIALHLQAQISSAQVTSDKVNLQTSLPFMLFLRSALLMRHYHMMYFIVSINLLLSLSTNKISIMKQTFIEHLHVWAGMLNVNVFITYLSKTLKYILSIGVIRVSWIYLGLLCNALFSC